MAHGLREDVIRPYLDAHPHELLFITASGAHLYGFASPNSDYDLRGAHITAAREWLGMRTPRETYDVLDRDVPVEMDIVTHDVRKYFQMLAGRNGYVLEQVCSPIIIWARPEFDELRSITMRCVTKHHRHHFRSFATRQWNDVAGSSAGTVKGLLYTYRPLLAGIHLMRERVVESNLRKLNEVFRLSYLDDLIDRKVSGDEKQLLGGMDMAFHASEFDRLNADLDAAAEASGLPEEPAAYAELNDLLVRLRLSTLQS